MRRAVAVVVVAACGAAPPQPVASSTTATSSTAKPKPQPTDKVRERAPVDPIAGLAPVPDGGDVSWMVPGKLLLELGGTPIASPGGNRSMEVSILDEAGKQVRVAIRLDHARFSGWIERGWLLAVVTREQRVSTGPGALPMGDIRVALRPGARVRRVAHKDGATHVRYIGALEVEGWIPDEALADAAPRRRGHGRIPAGRRQQLVTPGSTFRSEPRWASATLAVVANGYLVDVVGPTAAEGWNEMAYADGEVDVRGYLSLRDPPSRVHRTKDPDVPPVMSTPNDKVASGTCLFSRPNGDAIGYVVGDRDVQLEDAGGGWWTLYVDSPWGAIPFAARGPSPAALFPCAPAGALPTPPPPAPAPPVP
ncbi:MAG: hypothetical protein KIT31_07470 [Deltaproteobacteria bacterium]|nr:hypothetical protein [Deltaproteobacteria bacterium]